MWTERKTHADGDRLRGKPDRHVQRGALAAFQMDAPPDRETRKQADRQTDTGADQGTGRRTNWQPNTHGNRKVDGKTNRQKRKHTD